MSTHIFPPGHFETAQRIGVNGFDDPATEIALELAFTLPKLQAENGVLSFSLEELTSYHLLHYGASRVATEALVETLNENGPSEIWMFKYAGPIANKIKELQRVLKEGLESGGLNGGSMALGRIAVGHGVDIPPELKDFTELVDITHSDSDVMRTERFLYPPEKVTMSYTGRIFSEEAVEYMTRFCNSFAEYSASKHPDDFYLDCIKVLAGRERREFIVASSLTSIGVIEPWGPKI